MEFIKENKENMMMRKKLFFGSLLILTTCGLSSCIDEDLSDCPPPAKAVELSYELKVSQDVSLGFSDEVHSLHLGFWNQPTNLYREVTLMDEEIPEDMLFTITLPVDNYQHIAVANGEQSDGSYLPYAPDINQAVLSYKFLKPDTIPASGFPAYTGKLQMNMVKTFKDEKYEVLLEPVSGKYNLHVNHPGTLKNTKCFIKGGHQGLALWEQTWIMDEDIVTDVNSFATVVSNQEMNYVFYALPTWTPSVTTKAETMQEGWWKVYFYSELGDKIVQHIFTIKEGVKAGDVFEATFNLTEYGGEVIDADAGVEFNPDWQPGNDYEIEM